jgi:lipopolysaccharide transport system ATP-binding protein
MSSDIAINVASLSKCYQIYAQPHDRLKQSIYPRLQRLAGKSPEQYFREFWALKDVSFQVNRGETVGIIGRNGSGKSTLLQMICGTVNPTSGSLQTHGRIAALLELGSGFNPEFTGRENVYLNAAVLGLSRDEIDVRFNDIVTFADIGEFVDQPVKTYSSGMMLRLAFGVIAHVDSDILVVDEALAVGDAVFVQKCMRFLHRFMERGTLLFVSHDIGSVHKLCDRAIWLDHGVSRMQGNVADVANAYAMFCAQEIYGESVRLNAVGNEKSAVQPAPNQVEPETKITFYENIANSEGWRTGAAEIQNVSIMHTDGTPVDVLDGGERLRLRIEVAVHKPLTSPIVGFFVKDRLGQSLFGENTYAYVQPSIFVAADQTIVSEFVFAIPLLPNGDYSMTVAIADGDPDNHVQHHWLHDAVILRVQSSKRRHGLVGIPIESVSMQTKQF